jgi:hypothetical protein
MLLMITIIGGRIVPRDDRSRRSAETGDLTDGLPLTV